jgi:homoserine kinase
MSGMDRATAWAPASVSNMGPGYDALGAALSGLGDTIDVERLPHPGLEVVWHPHSRWTGTPGAASNTAAISAASVAREVGYEGGLRIIIRKGLGAGTGLGSSAASSVAAAVATEQLLGVPLSARSMLDAVIAGESAASGAGHGDNVLPSLLGGFVLLRSRAPAQHARISSWPTLRVVILLPEMSILTRDARAVLPGQLPLAAAVDHAARLALLVDALHRQDTEALGAWMMSDTVVEPARSAFLPHLPVLREAALAAGAHGCTVSGSGPAIMAVCDGEDAAQADVQAEKICHALLEASTLHGWHAAAKVHRICNEGARLMTPSGSVSWRGRTPCPWPTEDSHG